MGMVRQSQVANKVEGLIVDFREVNELCKKQLALKKTNM